VRAHLIVFVELGDVEDFSGLAGNLTAVCDWTIVDVSPELRAFRVAFIGRGFR
jgi:hypothetical protein